MAEGTVSTGGEPIERLVQDLLDTGEMNPETVADLERMRNDFREGTLDADDRDYLVALHGRLLGEGAVPATPFDDAPGEAVHVAEAAAVAEGWRERAEAAETRLEGARERIAALLAEARHQDGIEAVARVGALTEALAAIEGVAAPVEAETPRE
ncbi:hypothetical protein EMQ25_03515 [Arsenicitalea aurantiaca]|uniref:Uncharacterized protein n=1 Tax=Arsenicitalea aurantiaca TaxID=1783274 RepID=A0A433XLV0_9HYPH|nr:hypothetical protein [Arsenicitalea aurantiaca]RUT35033.1 hypothetical protein EMQ25_03515 [Arsenicitalea aurantiaca]